MGVHENLKRKNPYINTLRKDLRKSGELVDVRKQR
jgi:hypothetical protein